MALGPKSLALALTLALGSESLALALWLKSLALALALRPKALLTSLAVVHHNIVTDYYWRSQRDIAGAGNRSTSNESSTQYSG